MFRHRLPISTSEEAQTPLARAGRPALRLAVLGFLLVLVLAPAASAQTEDTTATPPGRDVFASVDESNCYEALVPRTARWEEANALVPDNYTVTNTAASGLPKTARLRITDTHCEEVSVNGHPPVRDTTTSYASIQIEARDNEPAVGHTYLITIVTDNPVLFAHYRAADLPVSFSPRTGSSEFFNADGTTSMVQWNVVGGGLTHTLTASPTAPTGPVAPSAGTWWFDGKHGDLRLAFTNLATTPSPARLTADFTQASAIADLFTTEAAKTPNAIFPGGYSRGSWTGVLEEMD